MSLWGSTIQSEGHIAGNVPSFGTACGDDSGCAGNGKHTALWHVFFSGKSAGCGSYGCSARSPDTAAMHADDSRRVDTDDPDDTDRRETMSDE